MAPNTLTMFRIIVAPIFPILFLSNNRWLVLTSFILLVIAELTDLLDGYIARKYNIVTDIGKLLDPLADRILNFTVFLSIFALGYAKIWMILIIFYRDVMVYWFRVISAANNIILSARKSGKIKTLIHSINNIIIVFLLTINYWWNIKSLYEINYTLMLISTLVTIYSGIDYFIANKENLTKKE